MRKVREVYWQVGYLLLVLVALVLASGAPNDWPGG